MKLFWHLLLVEILQVSAFLFALERGLMDELVDSIKINGVLTPVIVRPDGDRYEMISGHIRLHAAKRAGLRKIPAIVKEMQDDEAIIFMVVLISIFVLQKISDLLCLENGLSVIKPRPYGEREKRTTYPKYNGFRDEIHNSISIALGKRPADFNAFLLELQSQGYQINSFEAPGVEASRHIVLKLLGVDSGMPYYIDILLFYKRIDCGILYI